MVSAHYDPAVSSDLRRNMNQEMLCYITRCVTEGI